VPAPTPEPQTETTESESFDLATEQAFFGLTTGASDQPVAYDTDGYAEESRWPTLDLEGREQRRAHFTRVVGIIVGTLSVVALLAVTRLGPSAAPSEPLSASPAAPAPAAPSAEPEPTLLPELSVSAPEPEPEPSRATAPSAAPVREKVRVARPAPLARPRERAAQAPQAPAATPKPAQSDKLLPPSARFAD